MVKQLCAFCGDYTELVRVCLTPQCESCQIDRELQPDLPCLPECTFQHQAFPDSKSGNVAVTPVARQIDLLKTLAKVFVDRVKTLATEAETNLAAVAQAINLAKIYRLINLADDSSFKEHVLVQDQLLFLMECCSQFGSILTVLTQLPVETESLTYLNQQLDRIDGFLNYVTVATVKPLLLPGHNLPLAADIIRAGNFKANSNQRIGYRRTAMICNAVLAPGCQDDIIMTATGSTEVAAPFGSTGVVKVYYNLTRSEKALVPETGFETSVGWLPDYYNNFLADEKLTFSSTGVWIYDISGARLVKHTTLVGDLAVKYSTTTLDQTTTRPYRLVSDCAGAAGDGQVTDRMVMISTEYVNNDAIDVCSAWILTSAVAGSKWTRLWSFNITPVNTEVLFCDLNLTSSHVIVAACCYDGLNHTLPMTILDFATGVVVNRVDIGAEVDSEPVVLDDIVYFSLINYRLNILTRPLRENVNYYIYTLDGQLAHSQANFFSGHIRVDGGANLDFIKDGQGQTKLVIYED